MVISRLGEDRFACCGEIVVLSAKSLGMAGIEVDGPHTDIVRIKEIGLLPVLVIVVGLADSLLRKKR